MAHIRPSDTIFSPSVARLASSAAKDWSHVDSWLAVKFHGRPVAFERNPETLKALVALAALNEAVDDERDLVFSVEAAAIQAAAYNFGQDLDITPSPHILDGVVAAIEQELPLEGSAALDALATAAIELGIAYPESEGLGREVVRLQTVLYKLDQTIDRIATVQSGIDCELAESGALIQELEDGAYRPTTGLGKANLELQRQVKAGTVNLKEMREQAAKTDDEQADSSVQQLRDEEHLFFGLLARKGDLDSQVESFQGLPPDSHLARQQLETLRDQLRAIIQKRDAVFEGLVERETPRKPR